jgi:penicillin amidase/acyl-homoserine-lactone acylase
MKSWLRWILALLVILLGAVGWWLWSPLPPHPDTTPYLEAATAYDVEILRDRWGVPHVFGTRDTDAAFGLAYAHAEDDFETIQLTVAVTRGRLARYKGPLAVSSDYIVALLDVWGVTERGYSDELPPEARALAEAYADGVNLYAAKHLEETWKGLLPFTGRDVVAGFVLKTPFFYKFDQTLLSLYGDDPPHEIAREPGGEDQAFPMGPSSLAPLGSNAFAVAPSRSADGRTRLVANSHQPFVGPVAWYEAHVVSEEGLDRYGTLFPGSPLVLLGFNRELGWTNTVNRPDLADVYVLECDPEDWTRYRLDGGWETLERAETVIEMKLFGPFVWKVRLPVLRSRHGPVIATEHGTYAIRYAGMGEIRQLEQYRRLNKAGSFEEWMAALEMNALPSINYVYADREGRIAFVHNGQFPNRVEGWDWSKLLPGDRSDLIWDGYRPFDAVPRLIDPASGFLYSANNTPFSATDGPDNLAPRAFPASMGLETVETNRSLRIQELTDGRAPLDEAALLAIKFDGRYSRRSVVAKTVEAILDEDWSAEPELAAAAEHLRKWDLGTDVENRHAALGVLATIGAATERMKGIPAPPPADAFRRAVELLEKSHGRIDPRWGEVNRIVRGDVDLPLDGGPEVLRAIYPEEVGEDGRLIAAAGDTWIGIVSWGPDGALEAKSIHQFGSATLDASSPHHADQAPLFAAKRFKPVLMDRGAIEAEATARYRPGAEN